MWKKRGKKKKEQQYKWHELRGKSKEISERERERWKRISQQSKDKRKNNAEKGTEGKGEMREVREREIGVPTP